ncbi:MAG: hypothetical protein ABR585_07610 [Gemmatimonadaceae bacterium]
MSIIPFPKREPDPNPDAIIEPCRLCKEQGRSFEGTGLPIFKRFLGGTVQACLLCDGTGWPDYFLIYPDQEPRIESNGDL